MSADAKTIFLKDYTPPAYLIDTVHLSVRLNGANTRVLSRIAFRPNPDSSDTTFFLHGEDLRLISAKIDGTPVTPTTTDAGLTCRVPNGPFLWEASHPELPTLLWH